MLVRTVVVSNSLNSVTSTVASLSVVVDTFPPTLVSAVGRPSRTHVLVKFSEPVTIGTAEEINNYAITNLAGVELSISTAVLVNPITVDLTTSLQAPETAYVVVVSFVEDVSPQHNVILPGSTIGFTSSAPGGEIGGVLLREFYEGLGGNTIGDLINSTAFLGGNPTTTDFVTTFISPTHGDNYGARVSGYLLPTETSTYTFQMNRDDAGRIYLSTNSTQAGKVQILDGPCCGTLDSAPVVLLAGQSHYIEGLVKEGGGGDYLELRWKNTGSLPVFTNILATNLAYLYSLSITQQPTDQTYGANQGTTLMMQDFNGGDGGFTVTTPLAYAGPWVYNAGTGSWRENGQIVENGWTNVSFLSSPPIVLTTAGGVTLSFDHRYSFESGNWDGGQVLISVNGGAFTLVPGAAFTQNGYNGSAFAHGEDQPSSQTRPDLPEATSPARLTSGRLIMVTRFVCSSTPPMMRTPPATSHRRVGKLIHYSSSKVLPARSPSRWEPRPASQPISDTNGIAAMTVGRPMPRWVERFLHPTYCSRCRRTSGRCSDAKSASSATS